MSAAFSVGVVARHGDTPRDQEAREQLADAMPDADVGPIESEGGTFEVQLEADSQDDAIQQVIDAMAAAGVDDHLQLAEHRPPG